MCAHKIYSRDRMCTIRRATAMGDAVCDETGHHVMGHLVDRSVFGNLETVTRCSEVLQVAANRKQPANTSCS